MKLSDVWGGSMLWAPSLDEKLRNILKGIEIMRVIASTDKCIASGSCVLACPQVFEQRDEDGVVHIVNEHPSLDLLKQVKQAVELCPALVFRIEDEEQTESLTVVEETGDL